MAGKAAAPRPSDVVFVVTVEGALAGVCGLHDIDWLHRRAEFGIWIGEPRGAGVGTAAARLCLGWAFDFLRLRSVHLEAAAWNAGALKAYERAGFRHVGVLRDAWHGEADLVLMDAVPADLS